ncbi:hypothetical protein F5Y14DRAFT_455168 [Nemania sp. NC0429]|nr:hypothetical protein F5Y14DRAFT_455168 [Nemania sp. NC0429]
MSRPDKKSQYVDKIEAAGYKIDRNNVMHAWHVDPNGTSEFPEVRGQPRPQHMWLETGNKKSGYQHVISEQGTEYERSGMSRAQQPTRLPELMEASTTVGRHIGYNSKRYDRPVMAVYMQDEERVVRNSITVATNGYVVGMNPLSKDKVRRRDEDPREVSERTMENLYHYPPPPMTPERRRTHGAQASQPSPTETTYKHPTNKW